MKKKLSINFILYTANQFLGLLVPLITTPYISRILKPEGIGIVSYISAVASYFVLLASLGTGTVGQRYISFYQDDIDNRTKNFWSVELLSIVTSIISMVIYIVYAVIFSEYKIVSLIYSISVLTVLFDISWLFLGMEDMRRIVIRDVIIKILQVVFIFLLVKTRDDIGIYSLINCTCGLIGALSMWPLRKKYVNKCNWNVRQLKSLFGESLQIFIPVMATLLYQSVDKIMIGMITYNQVQNGYYEQTVKIIRMLNVLITAIGTTILPRFGYYYKNEKHEELRGIFGKGFQYCWMVSMLLFAGSFGCIGVIQPWLFGEGFEPTVQLIQAYAFRYFATASTVLVTNYAIQTMRQRTLGISQALALVLNAIMNMILIPQMLAMGAVIASVAAEVCVALFYYVYFYKELQVGFLLKSIWRYPIGGIIVALTSSYLSKHFYGSIVNSIVVIFITTVMYVGILFVMRDPLLISTVENGLSWMKRRINK